MALGQQRLGVNVVSLIAARREEARLPLRTIQWCLETVRGLRLSTSAIVAATRKVAGKGQRKLAGILECIRGSPVVHADETGWPQDGHNGYLWTFSTPTQRYFPCSSQGQALRRDIHDLRTLYPDDAPLTRWAKAVRGIYDRAKTCTHLAEKQRRTAQLALERQLLTICRPFLDDPLAVQARLCRRIERHIRSRPRTGYGELFVFVAEPEAPPDHNPAERSRRHLVISRKVSGGARSERGTASKMTRASLFGAWRARGLNPLAACRQLLSSPQL